MRQPLKQDENIRSARCRIRAVNAVATYLLPPQYCSVGQWAFGDFAAGYTIAERPDVRVLRDPFSAKPHVLFYALKRVGGDVSDYAAIKLLKIAVS